MKADAQVGIIEKTEGDTKPLLQQSTSTIVVGQSRRYFPIRFIVLLLSFIGIFVCYAIRVILSVAIIPISADYNWNKDQSGLVLASFYWGYIWTQIPGGWLAAKYSSKVVFGIGVVWASLLTIVTPFVVNQLWLMLLFRILTGLGEGVTYPTLHTILANWVPKNERFWALAFTWSGASVATILTNLFAPMIIDTWGWQSVFYATGGLGVIWFALWFIFTASKPEEMQQNWIFKHITESEVNQIVSNREANQSLSYNRIPWRAFITSMPVWTVIINHFCNNWGYYIILNWLPTYIKETLHYDLSESGAVLFIPYLVNLFVSTLAAFSATMIITSKRLSVTNVRKLMESLAFLTPAFFLLLLGFSQPTNTEAVVYMSLAVGITGFGVAGYAGNHIDISPRYAGVLMGISNTIATIPGMTGVYITGLILDRTNDNWAIVFTIAAAIYIFGIEVWLLFVSGEPIDFDKESSKGNQPPV